MPANSYGIVVEGPYDEAIYPELTRRIFARRDLPIIPRVYGGKVSFNKKLLALLRTLQTEMEGRGVEKILVIRDSGAKDSNDIETQLIQGIAAQTWPFIHGVHVCIIRREMETWLLADVAAINAVALQRGGRGVAEVQGELEEIQDPKEKLRQLLSEAKLDYTMQVCAEIARLVSFESLRYRCPSFCTFEHHVIHC